MKPSGTRPVLLIVDDDPAVLDLVGRFGENAGFEVVRCAGGRDAIEYLAHARADLAIVDLRMPDVGGLDVLRAMRNADPDCQVILMSGDATVDSVVDGIKLGATDYLTKPFDVARLKTLLTTVNDEAARRRRLLAAEQQVAKNAEFCGMIGRSPAMQELFGLIRRLAPHIRTALITGETGVGKELVARAIFQLGPRRQKKFVPINCSAIMESLFESELFGHMRGAFTGATEAKRGLFEVADGGTLFLDEIGELPLAVQGKLLRVLESGEVQRVGGVDGRRVDVTVLAATNRDLTAEISAGRFRTDLFYRLNVVELRVPPLREHREDIPYLTAAFIRSVNARTGQKIVGTTPSAERRLVEAPWDGNVRELRNVLERATILAEGEFITERDLNSSLTAAAALSLATSSASSPSAHAPTPASEALFTLERDHVLEVLQRVGGNKMAAARILGVSRRALYRRLERYSGDTGPTDS